MEQDFASKTSDVRAMNHFTTEEINLICLYNPGTRTGLMENLAAMRSYLQPDETELLALTGRVLEKLRGMDDRAFSELDLYPDFMD